MQRLFSIIIPAHNEEEILGKTLDNIKRDVGKECEIIIVCDRCSDRTVEIAYQYTMKVFEGNFGSAAKARNYGAKMAENSILVFIDADTITDKGYYREIKRAFTEDKAEYGTAGFKSESGNIIGRHIASSFNKYNRRKKTMGGNCFVERMAFNDAKGFDVNLVKGEDTDLGIRLGKAGCQYAWLDNTWILHNERRFREHGYIRYYVRIWLESVVYEISPKLYKRFIGDYKGIENR